MKIEYIIGCINNSLTIDEEEVTDININKLKSIVKHLVDKTDDTSILQELILSFVQEYGKWKYLGTCEQCGDSIDKFVYEEP